MACLKKVKFSEERWISDAKCWDNNSKNTKESSRGSDKVKGKSINSNFINSKYSALSNCSFKEWWAVVGYIKNRFERLNEWFRKW